MTARWWALHIAPQSRRDLGNIDVRNWRPRPAALIVGLALLIAVTLTAPIVVAWLATWLPSGPARYVGWFLSLTAVFAYVSAVTTGRGGNPLRGRYGGFRDIVVVHLVGLLVFLLTGARPDDGHGTILAVGLIAGAHLSYLEKLPSSWVGSLTAVNWRAGGLGGRFSIAARIGLAGAALVALCLFAADRWVVLASGVLIVALCWISRAVRPAGYFPHVHHWLVFAWLAVLGAQVVPVLAVSMAAFVEGAARWSCAPLWHRRDWR